MEIKHGETNLKTDLYEKAKVSKTKYQGGKFEGGMKYRKLLKLSIRYAGQKITLFQDTVNYFLHLKPQMNIFLQ